MNEDLSHELMGTLWYNHIHNEMYMFVKTSTLELNLICLTSTQIDIGNRWTDRKEQNTLKFLKQMKKWGFIKLNVKLSELLKSDPKTVAILYGEK